MPTSSKNWTLLSLEQALSSLDDGALPPPSVDDLACLLQKCRKEKNQSYALCLHAHLHGWGLDAQALLGNLLLLVLVGAGCLSVAQQIFQKLAHPDASSWNFLITGCVQHGLPADALALYHHMRRDASLRVSAHAFGALFKACTKLKQVELGCSIHAEVVGNGLLESNLFIASSVVDMYAKCGFLTEAQGVFDMLRARDAVLWTALIGGYVECGQSKEALSLFRSMEQEGFSPDATAFVCSLKACRNLRFLMRGRELYTDAVRRGLDRELLVGNILVDMYAKCGSMMESQVVFNNHLTKSIESWNALITAYEGHGCLEEALRWFGKLQLEEGITPDLITFTSCLKACGGLGASDKGQEIHADFLCKGLGKDGVVGSALVDMYAGCGLLEEAQEVFDGLEVRDVVSWTALIVGFAQCGRARTVYDAFDTMLGTGIEPNSVTLLSMLTVCNHEGFVREGETYLGSACEFYGILPAREHFTCLIDLFGRAGFIGKALALAKKMPFHPCIEVWHTVLSACQRLGGVELGRLAFEHSVQLDDEDAGAYICMSNLYANAGMQEDAEKVELMRLERDAWDCSESSDWPDFSLLSSDY